MANITPTSSGSIKDRWKEKQDVSASDLKKKQEEEIKKNLQPKPQPTKPAVGPPANTTSGPKPSSPALNRALPTKPTPSTTTAAGAKASVPAQNKPQATTTNKPQATTTNKPDSSKILEEYEAMKQKLAIYEATQSQQANVAKEEDEEEKQKARSIFDAFDSDKSGAIDWKEFQAVAFKLGQVLTEAEAKESLKEIDTDGSGGIDFEEFYAWWSSPFKNLDSSSKKNIHMLKLQLQSKAFASGFSNFASKLAAATAAVEKSGDKSSNENTKIDLKVALGSFKEARSSLSFNYKVDAKEAERQRKAAGAKNDTAIVSISFAVKEKVDPFALGELSGNIKTILALASKPMQKVVESFEAKIEKDGSTVIYRLYFLVKNIKNMLDIVKSVPIEELHGKLELSEKPGDPASGFFKARAEFVASAKRAELKNIVYTLTEPKKTGYVTKAKKKALAQYRSALLLRNLKQEIAVDGLAEIFKLLNIKTPPPQLPQGFASLIFSYSEEIAKILLDEKIPDIGRETYTNAILMLAGIHGATIVVGDAVLTANLKGMSVFDGYLPTMEQLKLLQGGTKQFKKGDINFESKDGERPILSFSHFDCGVKPSNGESDVFLGIIPYKKKDAKTIQFISYSERIVVLWTYNNDKFEPKLFLNPTKNKISSVTIRKDGLFAVCAGNQILISSINTRNNLLIAFKTLQHGNEDNVVRKFYFLSSDRSGLSIGSDNGVRLWDLKAAAELGNHYFEKSIVAFVGSKSNYFFIGTDNVIQSIEVKNSTAIKLKPPFKLKSTVPPTNILSEDSLGFDIVVIHKDNTCSAVKLNFTSDTFEEVDISNAKFTTGKLQCITSKLDSLKFEFYDDVKNEKGEYQVKTWKVKGGKRKISDLDKPNPSEVVSDEEKGYVLGYSKFLVAAQFALKMENNVPDAKVFSSSTGELTVVLNFVGQQDAELQLLLDSLKD